MSIYKEARKAHNDNLKVRKTEEEIADELNITRTTLYRYEQEQTPVPADMVVQMSYLYGQPSLRAEHCAICPIGRIDHPYCQQNQILQNTTILKKGSEKALEFFQTISNRMRNEELSQLEKKSLYDHLALKFAMLQEITTEISTVLEQWNSEC